MGKNDRAGAGAGTVHVTRIATSTEVGCQNFG